MELNKRKLPACLVAGLISIGALCLFLYRLSGHWGEVWGVLQRTDYLLMLPALALVAMVYLLRVARWRLFLRPIHAVQWKNALSATVIGFATNNLLPARLGEVVRPYFISRRENVEFSHALATVGLARIFDLMGLAFLLFLVGVLAGPSGPTRGGASAAEKAAERYAAENTVKVTASGAPKTESEGGDQRMIMRVWYGGVIVSGVAATTVLILFLMAVWPAPVVRIGDKIIQLFPLQWRPRMEGILTSLLESLDCLKSCRGVTAGLLLSGAIWMSQSVSTWMLAWGLGVDLNLTAVFLVTLAIAGAVAIPQAPGYLGTFHLAAALVAEAFNVNTGAAGAFAMLVWVVNVIPITLVGACFLVWEGFNLGELQKRSQEMDESGGRTD